MRILIALGRSALVRRGEPMTMAHQMANIRRAALQIARLADGNELVVTHGNGPQVGLLALQATAATGVAGAAPLDVLGAESEGMIGYLLEQEPANALPAQRQAATLLTRVEVDPQDPAFRHPAKPIGPVYTEAEAERLTSRTDWIFARDGNEFRRVVASPKPQRIMALQSIEWLLERNVVVIAAGGGGIPVSAAHDRQTRSGVEAVIDKDLCSALLATDMGADLLLIATDVDAVYADWHTPYERILSQVSAAGLRSMPFPAHSMGPKVQAACDFVTRTGKRAVIGSIDHIEAMAAGTTGTQITL
ncbi:carbamate kinase [Paraburkholderia ginsengiterrae]|uniref:Carbamate kinase n=1 Tax=Paraburkholderia ginsengiterrae TaxID=1462993 RepID=A0ABX2UW37_9BURK|nr:carbamate kinase [Paraburkholderia ginsengiterrae]OAJ59057.1 carbamate kinase [Paraburkholderia ginsengiterrae]